MLPFTQLVLLQTESEKPSYTQCYRDIKGIIPNLAQERKGEPLSYILDTSPLGALLTWAFEPSTLKMSAFTICDLLHYKARQSMRLWAPLEQM